MGEDLLGNLADSAVAMAAAIHEDLDRDLVVQQRQQTASSGAPDINIPFLAEPAELLMWDPNNPTDLLDVGLRPPQIYEADVSLNFARSRKMAKRGDCIWGAWFFFSFYFRPLLSEKFKNRTVEDANGGVSVYEKSNLLLDSFLVQHDMENMYMWVFKERRDNALGKMQLRSYMNGHSRPGEPQFPFSVDKGFVRSHRMQRKHYRGLSNPQCIHGIELVRSPNLSVLSDMDRRRWADLTGRDLNFSVPPEASDFSSWRNLLGSELELERVIPPMKSNHHPRKLLNGSGLNLSSTSNTSGEDGLDLSPSSCKRKKEAFLHSIDMECFLPLNSCSGRTIQDIDMHPVEPSWLHDFSGVIRQASGPVIAAKSIYEDEDGYLVMVSLPFVDQRSVKVSWRNIATHGIVKILCVSTSCAPHLKRHDRVFKLTDSSPEHCPPGEFVREIPLPMRIPEDAKLEAYFDESGTLLEIIVPKHPSGPEEHEVRVCMRPPQFAANELSYIL